MARLEDAVKRQLNDHLDAILAIVTDGDLSKTNGSVQVSRDVNRNVTVSFKTTLRFPGRDLAEVATR